MRRWVAAGAQHSELVFWHRSAFFLQGSVCTVIVLLLFRYFMLFKIVKDKWFQQLLEKQKFYVYVLYVYL